MGPAHSSNTGYNRGVLDSMDVNNALPLEKEKGMGSFDS